MKEQIRGKRLLSILLACIMMISLVPMTAFATGADVMEVSTADGYYNAIRMNSESTARTVKLTNDIDISALDNYAADVYADLTIDLNGHTLTLGGKSVKFWFYKNANVTITDTSDAKTGTISQTENNHAIDASFYGNAGYGTPDTVKLTVDGITIKGSVGTMANSPRAIFGRNDSNPPALIVKNTKIQDFLVGIQYFSNVQVSNTTVSRTEIGNVQQTSILCNHDTWTVNDILAAGQKLVVYNTTNNSVHSTPATDTKIIDIKANQHWESQYALEIRVERDGTAPLTNAEVPTITTHPVSTTYTTDDTAAALTVSASVSDDGSLSYQWYKNGSAIGGATSANYTPDISTVGSATYYCVVTNTNSSATGNTTATKQSNTATVTVNAPAHTHSWAATWSSNDTHHWHECTASAPTS